MVELLNAETGQRGFIITGDAAHRAPYDQALAEDRRRPSTAWPSSHGTTLSSRPPSDACACRSTSGCASWRATSRCGPTAVSKRPPQAWRPGHGLAVMQAVRAENDAMEATEHRLLGLRQAQARRQFIVATGGQAALAAAVVADALGVRPLGPEQPAGARDHGRGHPSRPRAAPRDAHQHRRRRHHGRPRWARHDDESRRRGTHRMDDAPRPPAGRSRTCSGFSTRRRESRSRVRSSARSRRAWSWAWPITRCSWPAMAPSGRLPTAPRPFATRTAGRSGRCSCSATSRTNAPPNAP